MDDLDTARTAARQDLRAAEAARVLGLLDTQELPARARRWRQFGLTTPAAVAPAAGPAGTGEGSQTVLVATLAAECGVSIQDPAVARAVHAETIIGMADQDFTTSLVTFSIGITDNLTGHLRRRLRRPR